MTDKLIFDNDCISAFLWVNAESVLNSLYSGRIIIPQHVYNELSHPGIIHLKKKLDDMVSQGHAQIRLLTINSKEEEIYLKLTSNTGQGNKIIGKGEAACLAIAQYNNFIVASNNLKDVKEYVELHNLKHTTTADIILEAYRNNYLRLENAESTWSAMIAKGRKIGATSFTNYLNKLKDIK